MDLFVLLNRVGMVLGFVSFWLAAPEIIGEEKLRAWEASLVEKPLKHVIGGLEFTKPIIGVFMCGGVFVFLGLMFWTTLRDFNWHTLTTGDTTSTPGIKTAEKYAYNAFGIGLAAFVLGHLIWGTQELIAKLLISLANDARFRRRSLTVGACLFILSFIMQFASTFAPPPEQAKQTSQASMKQ